ncbi:MAG: OmpA family protein [Gemmatimonadaceae bacterium]|nr:OmpA family protein [Gemmatimonadaceae bacterium]
MRKLLSAALAAALTLGALSDSVTAQEMGTIDAGFFGRYSLIDESLSPDDALSLGLHFGMFVFRNWALETQGSYGATSGDPSAKLAPFYVRLAYHRAFTDKWTGIIGAGWVRDNTDPPGPGDSFADDGFSGSLGALRHFNDRLALRFDIVGDYLPSPIFEGPGNDLTNVNLHFQMGLNWRWGVKPPAPDSDNDGVPDAQDQCQGTAMGAYVNYFGCVPEGDADMDGVLDSADRCANSPRGEPVTATGCPVDTDNDGVIDSADRCPNTPAGTRVNATGCPLDTDGDGVLDANDRCPNTPAGTRVNAQGCVPDGDGDGVPDPMDACPNTPAGTAVDARGCTQLFTAERREIVLEGVTFATGSANLTAESNEILDRVAEALVNNPEVRVEVQGHTDNTGSLAGNNRISAARAASVRQYLISKGVAANRLTARGYGPTRPRADNGTADGRQQNRRVELQRIDQ